MIRSMTGYGRGSAGVEGRTVTAELRSVNSKQREIRFRLPQDFYPLEAKLRARVAKEILRGRVDVNVSWERAPDADSGRVRLNRETAASLIDAWQALVDEFDLADEPRAEALLRLPGVLEQAPPEAVDLEKLAGTAMAALDQALEQHRQVREEEGAKLMADLVARRETILRIVDRSRERVREAPAYLAEQVRARVSEILAELPVDEQRLAQEIAILAQRADVTEELVRLDAHLGRFAKLFDEGVTEVGRSLEFLVQEIRREVTTLAAKTSDPQVDEGTIVIKSELEKIREQAANLE